MSDQQAGGDSRQEDSPAEVQAQQRTVLDGAGRSWIWAICALLLLLLAALSLDTFFGTFQQKALQRHLFRVSGHVTLVVHVFTGSISVRGGGVDGHVTIQATRQASLMNTVPAISYSQQGSTITATELGGGGPNFGSRFVDFAITVPDKADLYINTDIGQITVQDISGKMSLSANRGPITATNVTLSGSSSVYSATGSITFSGALAAHSNDTIASNTGSVDVTLPRDASFHLDERSTTGTFSSSIPNLNAQLVNMLGSKVHGNVGSAPTVVLTLETSTGPINMHYALP